MQSLPLVVSVFMQITDIYSISEVSMDYGVSMFLVQRWHDPRLKFNGSEHIDLRAGSPLMKQVWTPDTYFPQEKRGHLHDVTMLNKQIRLTPQGEVTYDMRVSLLLTCYMRLHRFPMDTQNCGIDLESFGYTTRDVFLRWSNQSVILEDILMPDFTIGTPHISALLSEYPLGTYSRVRCEFLLERELMFYMMEHYLPSALLVILSWVSLWIDIEVTPARATLGVTTLLTLTTLSSGARQHLPKVSYSTALDVWMFVCSFFVFSALIEFAIVIYVYKLGGRATPQKHKKTKNTESSFPVLQETYQPSDGVQADHLSPSKSLTETKVYFPMEMEETRVKIQTDFKQIAMSIDRVSRVLYPLLFIMFILIYWTFYLYG
ncbi:glycine receptor subunit alpha-1-like [Glandiceps talaboti]